MRWLTLPALAVLVGCEVPPTQLLVFIDTDLDPADGEIDGFELTVLGPGEAPVELPRARFSLPDEPLPASFGVAPEEGDARRSVTVEAAALLDDQTIFTTLARTGYVEGQLERLDLFLARRCRTEADPCERLGLTCDRGGCRDPEIEPGEGSHDPGPRPDPLPAETSLTMANDIPDRLLLDSMRVAVDADSTAILAGPYLGELTVGDDTLEGTSISSVVVRVPPDGSAPAILATLTPQDGGDVFVHAVDVNRSSGQIVIVGAFVGRVRIGETEIAAEGARDGLVVLLDRSGELSAYDQYTGLDATVVVEDAVIGPGGLVGLTGFYRYAVSIGGFEVENPRYTENLFAGVRDADGIQWLCDFDDQRGTGVALASDGRLYVSGDTPTGERFLHVFSPDCSVESHFLESYAGSDPRVALAPDGRVLLATGMGGGTLDGAELEGSHGSTEGLVVSFDADFEYEWHRWFGSDLAEDMHDLAVTPSGSVHVAGSMAGPAYLDDPDEAVEYVDLEDGMAAAFDAEGAPLYTRGLGGPEWDHLSGVAYDEAEGAVVVVGASAGGGNFGGEQIGRGLILYRFVP